MSFKGSLQTVALPEVLHLLADTGKSGELHVHGSHHEGRIWFQEGRLAGHEVAGCDQPFEALFQLLRADDGDFAFDSDAFMPDQARRPEDGPGQLGPVLEMAEARLAEWTEIAAVVPSLDHRIQLISDAPGEAIFMDRSQWQLVVAIGAGGTVGEVLAGRDLKEFEGCRAVRDLVGLALVEISEPAGTDEPLDEPLDEPMAEPEHEPELEQTLVPAAEETTGDRYSSLRAALSEVEAAGGEPGSGSEDEDQADLDEAEEIPDDYGDNRAALHALLAEVTARTTPAPTDPVDIDPNPTGLAQANEAGSERAEVEQARSGEGTTDEEPINRGLLLKFLSSVRS